MHLSYPRMNTGHEYLITLFKNTYRALRSVCAINDVIMTILYSIGNVERIQQASFQFPKRRVIQALSQQHLYHFQRRIYSELRAVV